MKENWKLIGGVLGVSMTGLLAVGGWVMHTDDKAAEQAKALSAEHTAIKAEQSREHAFEKSILDEVHKAEEVLARHDERLKAIEARLVCAAVPAK